MRKHKLLNLRNSRRLACAAMMAITGTSAASAADYASTVLADNPVGYYRFEEPLGSTSLADSSVYGIAATAKPSADGSNPTLEHLGLQERSVYFNGTSPSGSTAGSFGSIDVPFRRELAPTNVYGLTDQYGKLRGGPFSVEVWTRSQIQRTDGKYEGIVAVTGPSRSTTPKWGGWILGKDNYGRWIFLMRNGPTLNAPAPTLMQWYHLAVTFDGTNVIMYVNGAPQGTSANTANYVPSDHDGITRPANIGNSRYSDSPWLGYKGEVDEVAFYTNALTAERILEHYQVGLESIVLPPQPPVLLTDLADVTSYANTPLTMKISAGGDLPLFYQWFRGSTAIGGETNSSYTFVPRYPEDNGATFSVTVTNAVGSTNSATATLSVSTELLLAPAADGSLMQTINRNVGSHAAFRPVAYGAQPIGYKWYKNDELMEGQTGAMLWLTNVQTVDNGARFTVVVTNPWTSASAEAYLSVQDRIVTVPLSGYGQIVAADKPVAYWRLNEAAGSATAVDAVGSFDGSLIDITTSFTGLFDFGLATGIPNETDTAMNISGGAVVSIPYAAELNPDAAWTAETWVRPSVVSDNPNTTYVIFSSEYNHATSVYNDWNGWYVTHGAARTFGFTPQPGGSANTIYAAPDDPENNNQIVAGKWYHLVMQKDANNFNVFINGKLRASRSAASTPFIPNGMGIRPEDGNQGHGETMIGSLHDRTRVAFSGTIDETAIYNYALSPSQILSHYLNSTTPPEVTLQMSRQSDKIILTWPLGTLQSASSLTGSFTDVQSATSPYTNSINGTMFFRVKVQ